MGALQKTRLTLWTRSAGRCEYEGCNKPLLGDLLSGKDELNDGYVAHIVAETPGGPRGDAKRSPALADSVENLMLMCNAHHRLIDHPQTSHEYPEERLLCMKVAHEHRIELVTDIQPDQATHVLLYGARVGAHDFPVRYDLAKRALLPERYPAQREAITLELRSDLADHEPEYWSFQPPNLRRQFERKVRDLLTDGHVKHISVFALAPQPLLIELGRLLSDMPEVGVHQLHREPQGWDWRDTRAPIEIDITSKPGRGKAVGLVLGLSATVVDERITAVIGEDAPIWRMTTAQPHNDIMHRREDLAAFRRAMRTVYDRIKAEHGQDATIHLFPALPVSAAIEVGRTWMPKADLPLVIYDENRTRGGFEPRLTIGDPAQNPAQKELSNA